MRMRENGDILRKIRKVKQLEESSRRLRYLSKEEYRKLIDAGEGYLKPIAIMALNTGTPECCRKVDFVQHLSI